MKKNGEYKIESNIQIPTSKSGGKGYGPILTKLQVGQSVVLPFSKHSNAWSCAANHIGKGKFKVRADGKGFRIWRSA